METEQGMGDFLVEQRIDAGRTELVNSGREQLLDAMLRGLDQAGH